MKINLIYIFTILVFASSCEKEFDFNANNKEVIFNTLWTHIDQNYSFFELKNIDWDAIRLDYKDRLATVNSEAALYNFCRDLLFELEDGHGRISNGNVFSAFDYTQGYDVFFDLDLIQENYLQNEFITIDGKITYGILNDTIGYVYYRNLRGDHFFNQILDTFTSNGVRKIILDLRNNRGGDIGNSTHIIQYLIDEENLLGYQVQKDGPGRNDFTELLPLQGLPAPNAQKIRTNILTNRTTYSAATILPGMTRQLDHFQIIGQISGGGGGGGQSFELPNAWVIDIPHGYFLDANLNHVELGIEPDIPVVNTEEDLMNGIDRMLEAAIGF